VRGEGTRWRPEVSTKREREKWKKMKVKKKPDIHLNRPLESIIEKGEEVILKRANNSLMIRVT